MPPNSLKCSFEVFAIFLSMIWSPKIPTSMARNLRGTTFSWLEGRNSLGQTADSLPSVINGKAHCGDTGSPLGCIRCCCWWQKQEEMGRVQTCSCSCRRGCTPGCLRWAQLGGFLVNALKHCRIFSCLLEQPPGMASSEELWTSKRSNSDVTPSLAVSQTPSPNFSFLPFLEVKYLKLCLEGKLYKQN